MRAAVAYAATRAGHDAILRDLLPLAEMLDDDDRQTRLQAALLRGEQRRAEAEERTRPARKPTRVAPGAELRRFAHDFAVARAQVDRDHAISHALAAVAESQVADQVVFYGGTALSRTLLPMLRLSEDIDLIARGERGETATSIERRVIERLRRTHGSATWEPLLSATKGAEPAMLRLRGGISIRVQMMRASDLPKWPTERRDLFQRYSDARPAALDVFTPAAFVAAKTVAWADRAAARDLYDLWALGHLGLINNEARTVYRQHAVSGGDPQPWMFREAPTDVAWHAALSHQGRVRISPTKALTTVADFWGAVPSGAD
jgi:predicted nucleotidyltransferase component of viral defense system